MQRDRRIGQGPERRGCAGEQYMPGLLGAGYPGDRAYGGNGEERRQRGGGRIETSGMRNWSSAGNRGGKKYGRDFGVWGKGDEWLLRGWGVL